MTDQTDVRNTENIFLKTACCLEEKILCVYRSDYRNYPPGQFRRIRPIIEQKLSLVLGKFCSAIMNYLTMTFTSRLKMDAKFVNQQ